MICVYSLGIFDPVFISKAALCSIPVAVFKWFLHPPFLLWVLENAMSLLCDVAQPLACITEVSGLGELKTGFKGRSSTLSSLSVTFRSVNSPYYFQRLQHLSLFPLWLLYICYLFRSICGLVITLPRTYSSGDRKERHSFSSLFFSPQRDIDKNCHSTKL